jgi:hypothetical protein
MNANQIAQIATSLNISPNQIKRAEEWATVLFVVVQGKGARFVSKKVIKNMNTTFKGIEITEGSSVWVKVRDGRSHKWDIATISKINDGKTQFSLQELPFVVDISTGDANLWGKEAEHFEVGYPYKWDYMMRISNSPTTGKFHA